MGNRISNLQRQSSMQINAGDMTMMTLNDPLMEGITDRSIHDFSQKDIEETKNCLKTVENGQLNSQIKDQTEADKYSKENDEVIERTDDMNWEIREKRPPYTFKTGAIYEGEWLGGNRDGVGKQVWPDGAKYDGKDLKGGLSIRRLGEWKNNKANGKGRFLHVNGDIYEGEFENNKIQGEGTCLFFASGAEYKGQWKNNVPDGHGKMTFVEGGSYEGDFKAGLKHGKGFEVWANGYMYNGDFYQHQATGTGVYHWPNGNKYEGQVLNGLNHGKGVFKWAGGGKYEGQYSKGVMHGKGVMVWPNGKKFKGWMVQGSTSTEKVFNAWEKYNELHPICLRILKGDDCKRSELTEN